MTPTRINIATRNLPPRAIVDVSVRAPLDFKPFGIFVPRDICAALAVNEVQVRRAEVGLSVDFVFINVTDADVPLRGFVFSVEDVLVK